MRESIGTWVVGMRSLISCMTRNIPYRIALFIWNMIDVLCMPLHVHFRWRVALVGKFSIGHCSPHCGEIFFRYWRYIGSRNWSRSFVVKKAGLWPIHLYFVIFWVEYLVLVM